MNVMVVRRPSFQPHWARLLSFGPMPRKDAERMVATPQGGRILTLKEWNEAHKRGEVE